MWRFYYIEKLGALIHFSNKVVQCSWIRSRLITMKNSADVFSTFQYVNSLMSEQQQKHYQIYM